MFQKSGTFIILDFENQIDSDEKLNDDSRKATDEPPETPNAEIC